MANLWIRFGKQFGGRWTSQYGDCDDGTWEAALRNVSNETLGQAMGRVALSAAEFPPTLPQFIAICARAMGLPDVAKAYADACHSKWSHAVVYEAAKLTGVFELRNRSERDMMPRFREQFGAVCAAWMAGERFEPPVMGRIEKHKPVPCPRDVAMAAMQKARTSLGGVA